MIDNIVIGILSAIVISVTGVKLRYLTIYGGIAAIAVGGTIFIFGGWKWAIVLLIFFFSSSLFSIILKQRKVNAELKYAKGPQRDAAQVLANGGLGALLSIVHFAHPTQNWPWWAYLTVIATVTADTWATEIGSLSKSLPVNIRTIKAVEPGTSGGISPLGLFASFTGASLIAFFNYFVFSSNASYVPFLVIAVLGFGGAIVDSWFGASFQGIYFDETLQIETENPPYKYSKPIRGWVWMNNDLVNFISSLIAGILSIIIL